MTKDKITNEARMRNARWILLMVVAGGCAAENTAENRKEIQAGYQSLKEQDYDSAMAQADQFLREHPNGGPGTPEALYLQGRVYEQRAATADAGGHQQEARADLQYARGNYEHALTLKPAPQLEALLYAGIANVAYFQEDYATAMQQWAAAYNGIEGAESKAWMLYRIGLCQQRLGRFEQADRSFAAVRQQFPSTIPGQRAASHMGARAFYVQVGAYADGTNADRAVAALRSQGLTAAKATEATGRLAVRVGPQSTYAEAKAIKTRLAAAYPSAMIEP